MRPVPLSEVFFCCMSGRSKVFSSAPLQCMARVAVRPFCSRLKPSSHPAPRALQANAGNRLPPHGARVVCVMKRSDLFGQLLVSQNNNIAYAVPPNFWGCVRPTLRSRPSFCLTNPIASLLSYVVSCWPWVSPLPLLWSCAPHDQRSDSLPLHGSAPAPESPPPRGARAAIPPMVV